MTRRARSSCPQPDSPTRPSVSPRAIVERDAVDRVDDRARRRRTTPRAREVLHEVLDLDERTPVSARAVPAMPTPTLVTPGPASALAADRAARRDGQVARARRGPGRRQQQRHARAGRPSHARTGSAGGTGTRSGPRSGSAASPRSGAGGSAARASARGSDCSRPRVYGCSGSVETPRQRPVLDDAARRTSPRPRRPSRRRRRDRG